MRCLIEITKSLAYMDESKYIQEVVLHEGQRLVHINKGAAGYKSIHIKNIKILKILEPMDLNLEIQNATAKVIADKLPEMVEKKSRSYDQ